MTTEASETGMRMAELAARSGLSVATIKYYLREGLLEPGRRTSVNQAVYSEVHLERLRLIRALATIAGLPLSTIRDVVHSVAADSSVLEAMALTQDAVVGSAGSVAESDTDGAPREAATIVDEVIRARGWQCEPGSPAYVAAVRAVEGLADEQLASVLEHIDDYAHAADAVGRTDLHTIVEAQTRDEMIRGAVLGTVLRRPLLEALVLLAQQHHAREMLSDRSHE